LWNNAANENARTAADRYLDFDTYHRADRYLLANGDFDSQTISDIYCNQHTPTNADRNRYHDTAAIADSDPAHW
jgi:hypothetical protein